jgi:hypothetical protein
MVSGGGVSVLVAEGAVRIEAGGAPLDEVKRYVDRGLDRLVDDIRRAVGAR